VWAILTGLVEIIAAIRLREEITNEIWLGLSGIISIIFGGFVVFFPGEGAVAVSWLIGLYAIFFGIFMIMVGIRLNSGETYGGGYTPNAV
jgi:uncharacterized membrane protein HdeD (DUF308 family)